MMNSTLSKIVIFTVGAAIGSAVTYKIVKEKFEQEKKEEIASVIESFSKLEESTEESESDDEDDSEEEYFLDEDEGQIEYEDIVKNEGYMPHIKDAVKKEEKNVTIRAPYVISPDEYGDSDYPTVSLWYYEGDGVLTNEKGKIIRNVDELVGEDFASHFGEYEDDSVFVRNEDQEIDYEILMDSRSFSEIS